MSMEGTDKVISHSLSSLASGSPSPVAQAEKSTISPAEVWAANGRKQGVPPQRQPAAETHTPATHLSTNVITECHVASLPQTETRDSHIKSTSVGSGEDG